MRILSFVFGVLCALALSADARAFQSSPATPANGLAAASPLSSVLQAASSCPGTEIYCTAKANSQGCLPELTYTGCLSASAGQGFVVTVTRVISNPSYSILLYSINGAANIPFGGGTLCVQPPLRRTPSKEKGQQPGTCTGFFSFDFNAWIATGNDPDLVFGQKVWMQYWYRDPFGFESNTIGLSRALAGLIGV